MIENVELVLDGAVRILGLGVLSTVVGAVTASLFRWYSGMPLPEGIAVLLGLSAVALWLNTTATLGLAIGGTDIAVGLQPAVLTLLSFAAGGIGADLGRRLGDRIGVNIVDMAHLPNIDGNVGELVRSKGRILRVRLPKEIDDISGYDTVSEDIKAEISDTVLLFPRPITTTELKTRIIERIKTDYSVGHVDIELTTDGSVEYLAVGGRTSGLGPTLAPGTVAVAIRADPPAAASTGDTVQVWDVTDSPTLVTDGEFRGKHGDVVTLAVDSSAVDALSATNQYRLATLPDSSSADREFASLLRSAPETMEKVTITEESTLIGQPVSALTGTTIAIRSEDGTTTVLPDTSRLIQAQDTLYLIASPDLLRQAKQLS